MSTKIRRTFSPEFRLDSAQLIVDQNYSIQEAALAVGIGHSTMDKWARQVTEEFRDITDCWRNDLVTFALGCSFSFEGALTADGLEVRNVIEGVNVPMYRTNTLSVCRTF